MCTDTNFICGASPATPCYTHPLQPIEIFTTLTRLVLGSKIQEDATSGCELWACQMKKVQSGHERGQVSHGLGNGMKWQTILEVAWDRIALHIRHDVLSTNSQSVDTQFMSWHLEARVTWDSSGFIIRAASGFELFPYLTLLSLFYTDHFSPPTYTEHESQYPLYPDNVLHHSSWPEQAGTD